MIEVEEYRKFHDMKVFGRDIPKPVETFEEANFPGIFPLNLFKFKFLWNKMFLE